MTLTDEAMERLKYLRKENGRTLIQECTSPAENRILSELIEILIDAEKATRGQP